MKKIVLYLFFAIIFITPITAYSQEEEEEGRDTTYITDEMVITGSRYLKKIIDVKTFKNIDDSFYYKDKNHIYYFHKWRRGMGWHVLRNG